MDASRGRRDPAQSFLFVYSDGWSRKNHMQVCTWGTFQDHDPECNTKPSDNRRKVCMLKKRQCGFGGSDHHAAPPSGQLDSVFHANMVNQYNEQRVSMSLACFHQHVLIHFQTSPSSRQVSVTCLQPNSPTEEYLIWTGTQCFCPGVFCEPREAIPQHV